ncbi:MAG: hypothetical protein NTY30_01310 [Candidatus Berkelbacteria bacterium]|nr:hypothetical protein [Candidatus Berkelbacteria bacterium]
MPSPNATTYQPVSRAEMIGWFEEWPQRIRHLFDKIKLDQLFDVECLGSCKKFKYNHPNRWFGISIAEAMEFDPQWEFSLFVNGNEMPNPKEFQFFGIFQPEFGWFQEGNPPDNRLMIGLTSKKKWIKIEIKSLNCGGIQLPKEIRIDDVEVQDFVQNYEDSSALASDFIARMGNLVEERQQYLVEMENIRQGFIADTTIFHRRMEGVNGAESQHQISAGRFAPDRRVGVIKRMPNGKLWVLAWMKPNEKLCDHCARIYNDVTCPYCK